MTGLVPRSQSPDDLDVWLLDPDLEQLFAEVDAILCEARARMRGPAHRWIPAPRPRRAKGPHSVQDPLGPRDRRPETGRATQRGPPQGRSRSWAANRPER